MDDTEAAPEVQTRSLRAWGEADPTDVIEYRERSWKAPILLAAAALAAVALVGTMWPRHHTEESRPQATPQSAPKPQVAPPPPTRDQRFLQLLPQRGVELVSPPAAIKGAHDVCRLESEGHQAKEIAEAFTQVTPGATLKTEGIFVMTAEEIYCPPKETP